MRFTADLDRGICSFLVIVALSSGALGLGTGSAEALPVDSASTHPAKPATAGEHRKRQGRPADHGLGHHAGPTRALVPPD